MLFKTELEVEFFLRLLMMMCNCKSTYTIAYHIACGVVL